MKNMCIGLLAGALGCLLARAPAAAEAARYKETTIYAFGDGTDGSEPEAGLLERKGTLYGATRAGGVNGSGAVIALDPDTGAEKLLYSFCSRQNCPDGAYPEATLLDVKGRLYSTTQWGGAHGSGSGGGTVFAIDPETGAETIVYSFCSRANCADGSLPEAGLIEANGTLYGTTGPAAPTAPPSAPAARCLRSTPQAASKPCCTRSEVSGTALHRAPA